MSTEELNIDVTEDKDGSAVANLPDGMNAATEEEETKQPQQTAEDDDEDDEDDESHDSPQGSPADEELRAARREKRRARKEYRKQAMAEERIRLANLQRQNQELLERLSVLERRTAGSELARVDKAIEDQELRLQYAKMKISEATAAGDGETLANAQEMWYEARRQKEALEAFKRRAVQQPSQQPATVQVDPELKRLANEWMSDNDWYDPNGRDPDSRVALTVDQAMAEEGWNPATPKYWTELDKRLRKYLPHRYTDYDDDYQSKSRPRSAVVGSGRETASVAGGKNQFVLSPEQVRAMKDAGMWDDPEKRTKMIKRYAEEARQRRN